MRSAFNLQVSVTGVLYYVKLRRGVLSLEVREQMLCSGLKKCLCVKASVCKSVCV